MSLHLFTFSLISLISMLQFSPYRSCACFLSLTLKYFLKKKIVNVIIFLITSSLIMDYLNVCLVLKCWQIFSLSLLLVSSLIPLYLENMLCTISILLNLSKFVLRPMIGSLLVSSCRHWEACTRCSCLWNVV